MLYKLPHTIDNNLGQILTFKKIVHETDGDKVINAGSCAPKTGPAMHIHYLQDEGFTLIKGHMM